MANAFHTIGHARHAIADFVALLAAAGVDFVVDVRAFPRSRSNPQFNGDTKRRSERIGRAKNRKSASEVRHVRVQLCQTDAPLLTNARERASFRNAGCDNSDR